MLLSEPVLTVATLPLGVAGVLLLLVGAAVTWGDGGHDAEEIVAPGQTPRPALTGRLLAAGVMSLRTLLLLGQVWLLHTLAR